MFYPFFELAGRSEARQRTFRRLVAAHLALVAGALLIQRLTGARPLTEMLGFTLLIAGIVEGAMLLGWRLSQLPKSRSLELALLCPVPTPLLMLGEQMVGLSFFLLLTATCIPVLALTVSKGWMDPVDALLLPVFGFTWGCVTGLGLAWWAYEPLSLRRWGERLFLGVILVYLIVGGLLGEHTFRWLSRLPGDLGFRIRDGFLVWHQSNPFALIHRLARGTDEGLLREVLLVEALGVGLIVAFLTRGALRLKAHYVERHYKPVAEKTEATRGSIADRPLSWWAVKRVSEYSGRINLWLALGASVLYSIYLLASDHWPTWLGRNTFHVFELLGGVGGMTTALVLLSAIPAAYQYGLWDSSIPERCRRLELLLLTELQGIDYLRASWSASWHRGRGYFLAALLLWGSATVAGRVGTAQALMALSAAGMMVALYFAVGFRYFASSTGNTTVGFLLSLGLPLSVWGLGAAGFDSVARLTPPGIVYYALTSPVDAAVYWLPLTLWTLLALWSIRRSLATFDRDLRTWYDENHGKR